MEEIAGWIAPAATMIAAVMTATNLGPRVTGWGFAVFLVGSVAWSTVAVLTHQPNLLWTNLFLCLVNLVGIWRWLGRMSRYDTGAEAAAAKSRRRAAPDLFAISLFDGQAVTDATGETIAHAVGAMAERKSGRIAYAVVSEGGVGGVGETLHRIEWDELDVADGGLRTKIGADALRGRPEIAADDWPG